MQYSVQDIANLVRGYIDGYPTFTGEAENGLVVLGYPKDSFWKHMWPSWDYNFIASLPKTVLSILVINIVLVFIIYVIANSRLLKSVEPIISGIQSLSTKEEVNIQEKGLFLNLLQVLIRPQKFCSPKTGSSVREKLQGQTGLQEYLMIYGHHYQW